MKRRWRVVCVAVNGEEAGLIGSTWTQWGARRIEQRHRDVGRSLYGTGAPTGVIEPIPGRPLYSVRIERA